MTRIPSGSRSVTGQAGRPSRPAPASAPGALTMSPAGPGAIRRVAASSVIENRKTTTSWLVLKLVPPRFCVSCEEETPHAALVAAVVFLLPAKRRVLPPSTKLVSRPEAEVGPWPLEPKGKMRPVLVAVAPETCCPLYAVSLVGAGLTQDGSAVRGAVEAGEGERVAHVTGGPVGHAGLEGDASQAQGRGARELDAGANQDGRAGGDLAGRAPRRTVVGRRLENDVGGLSIRGSGEPGDGEQSDSVLHLTISSRLFVCDTNHTLA
jgi:hypothetical protein